RRLYQIASLRTVTKTRAEKRRAIHIDLAIGLGIPLLRIPLQYIVEGHRYEIFQDIGCLGGTHETLLPSLSSTSPILNSAVYTVYCGVIKSFYHSRSQFRLLFSPSAHASLNLDRYFRSVWVLWVNMRVVGLSPWISWADTHSNSSRVVQVPGIYWHVGPYSAANVETLRCARVACALLFFAYFRFADEAINNYRGAFNSIAKRMGYTSAGS
ncbi:GPCR fungal pheromone mating factor, partial [Mycena leptocephala]